MNQDRETLSPLEQAIRAAGSFVRPTSNLRPRVIEAAKEQCGQQRAIRKAACLLLFVCLLAAVTAPFAMQLAKHVEQTQAASSEEVQKQATQYSAQAGIGSNWGLSEAFTRQRESQSRRFLRSFTSAR